MSIKAFTCIVLLLIETSMQSNIVFPGPTCDPFSFGTSSESYSAAIANGIQYPYACSCTYPCTASMVSLYVRFFYYRIGGSYYQSLSASASSIITSTDRSRPIKFLLHGYADKVQFNGTGWMEKTGIALGDAINGLVILVDWGMISNCNYSRTTMEIVPAIGSYLAQVISSPSYLGLDPANIELIGHGLGGHIAGSAGVILRGAINRITALDPSGDTIQNGLSIASGLFVQVLHVDVAKYGTSKLLGAGDFFVNSGSALQPGCTSNYCSHSRAVFYYYASIFSQYSFIASRCDLCISSSVCSSRFGLYNDRISGVFCFATTSCFPYFLATAISVITTTATTPVVVNPPLPPPSPPLPAPPLHPQLPPTYLIATPAPLPPPFRPHRRKCRRRRRKWKCRIITRKCMRPCRRRCRRNCRCCPLRIGK